MATFKNARRYYLHKRRRADASGTSSAASVWRSKQEDEPGTALPSDFPSLAALAVAGYTAEEDIDGADAQELHDTAGLTAAQSASVIAALAELP